MPLRAARKRGFTLLVLLVVVGILSTMALPQFTKTRDKAILAEAKVGVAAIADGMWSYYLENQRWPSRVVAGTDLIDKEISSYPTPSKFWDWAIDGSLAQAFSKGGKAYLGYDYVDLEIRTDGKRSPGWRIAGEQELHRGDRWPF